MNTNIGKFLGYATTAICFFSALAFALVTANGCYQIGMFSLQQSQHSDHLVGTIIGLCFCATGLLARSR